MHDFELANESCFIPKSLNRSELCICDFQMGFSVTEADNTVSDLLLLDDPKRTFLRNWMQKFFNPPRAALALVTPLIRGPTDFLIDRYVVFQENSLYYK